MKKTSLAAVVAMLLVGCQAANSDTDSKQLGIELKETQPFVSGCFEKTFNKDTTRLELRIEGDSVLGNMVWMPWEKDGAYGTLHGTKLASGEFDLIWRYMIEGSSQSETVRLKLEGDRVVRLVGELEDPANNGSLRYKNPDKAAYTDTLRAVKCK